MVPLSRMFLMTGRTRLRLGIPGVLLSLTFLAGCGPKARPPKVDLQQALRVDQFNCLITTDPKRVTIVGEVKNIGNRPVREALVVASLKSPTGRVKGSGQVVVVNLERGATRPFKIVSRFRGTPPKPKNIEITIHEPPPESSE